MLPIYNALTDREVSDIHEAALRVVAEAGVALDHPRAQEALAGAGARVSDDRRRVFLPRAVVETMLARAPREFLCAAPDPRHDLVMKRGASYARQGGGPFSFYDLRGARVRPLTFRDAVDSVRLINALPHIDAQSTVTPQDIDQATYDVAMVKMVLENTRKHFWALTTGAGHLKFELEMAAAAAGGPECLRRRPLMSGVFCVIAPLRFPADEIDRLILCGSYGVPVMTPLTVLVGGSAPYTLAGCLTQMTAEFLAAVSIAQALCPGLGQWYYTLFQYLDMRAGRTLTHSPELMVLGAAGAQMSAFYGLPSLANTLLSGDCQPHQAILQYGMNILLGLLNGVTFQAGAGSLDSGNLYCHQSLVIIDELLDYLKAFRRGLDVNAETLAVDDILAAADKGEYLSSRLTMKYLRREKRHQPDLLTFPSPHAWLQAPETILDRAEAKVRRLLAEAPDEPTLPPETRRELDRLLAAAGRELAAN